MNRVDEACSSGQPCSLCCSRPEAWRRICAPRPQLPPWRRRPGVRTLYLVRHGAYDIDDPRDEAVGRGLLPIGVAQARLAGDRLRGLPFTFDSIVASPLTRARETAEVIAAELDGRGRAVAIDPDLAECTPPTRRADIMAKEKPEELAACSAQLERLAARLGCSLRRCLRHRSRAATVTSSWSRTATSSAGW